MSCGKILCGDQRVSYHKDGEEMLVVDEATLDQLASNTIMAVRHVHPFIKTEGRIILPYQDESGWGTGLIKEIKRQGNSIIFEDQDHTYTFTYENIDLDRVLKDGVYKGVNERLDADTPAPFPRPD